MSLDFDFMLGTKPMKHAANSREINYVDETAFHTRKGNSFSLRDSTRWTCVKTDSFRELKLEITSMESTCVS